MTDGPTRDEPPRTRHIWTGLDGLRGIAVMGVVVFHLAVEWAGNGYVGVDVFFALSGFLITWLLLEEHDRTRHISLTRFYMRRILRLYPALVATVLLVLLLGLLAEQVDRVLPGAIAALLYAANWWIYTGREALLLEHTWTLAIEEHFYLLWPLLVILWMSRRGPVRAVGMVVTAVLAALVLLPWPEAFEGVRGSYLRGAPIVWGSLAAALLRRVEIGPRSRSIVGVAGLGALLVLSFMMVTPTRLPTEWMTGLRSLPGLLSVIVVIAVVASPGCMAARILSWAPLRWMGKRAYGIYLYHLPITMVLAFQLDVGLPDFARALLTVALTITVAGASYRWLETPFLRLKRRYASEDEGSARRSTEEWANHEDRRERCADGSALP